MHLLHNFFDAYNRVNNILHIAGFDWQVRKALLLIRAEWAIPSVIGLSETGKDTFPIIFQNKIEN